MLLLAFYFFHVLPEFSDFLFVFGFQELAVDVLFSAFHYNTRLKMHEQRLAVPEWSWSGFDVQMCYGLKSVERSASQAASPWSIRHCAMHHTFDIGHARMNWIVIKGNRDMENRIQDATSKSEGESSYSFDKIDRVFAAALDIHLLFCDWSTENWRWYIQYLENELELLTEGALTKNADTPVPPKVGPDVRAELNRTNTGATQDTQRSRVLSFPRGLVKRKTMTESVISVAPVPEKATFITETGKIQPRPPGWTEPGSRNHRRLVSRDDWGQQKIFFSTLQYVHDLEEKANEIAVVLRLNLKIMSQLRDFYIHLFAASPDHETLKVLKDKCSYELRQFEHRLDQKSSEVDLQIIRVEAFLRKLNDRKALVKLSSVRWAFDLRDHSFMPFSIMRTPKSINIWLKLQKSQTGTCCI